MEQYVMTTGTIRMPLLSAHNLDSLPLVYMFNEDFYPQHQNGFSISGAIAVTSGVFGDDTASTVLNSVTCSGNETGILDCSYSYSGTCSEHNAAVICQGKHISCSL